MELAPGTYILRRVVDGSRALEQAVVAAPGWQTQLFILKDPELGVPAGPDEAGGSSARPPRPDAISVLMSRDHFDAARADMETTELARLALTDERRIMSDELQAMLDGKFDNPMLGMYGGHLLLLSVDRAAAEAQSTTPDAKSTTPGSSNLPATVGIERLDVVVANLRSLMGTSQPDVEALSLRCADPRLRTRGPLATPPMLRRSWSLYVAASNERSDLIPRAIWNRVRHFVVTPPYFTWCRATAQDPVVRLARSVEKQDDAARSAAATAAPRSPSPPRPALGDASRRAARGARG